MPRLALPLETSLTFFADSAAKKEYDTKVFEDAALPDGKSRSLLCCTAHFRFNFSCNRHWRHKSPSQCRRISTSSRNADRIHRRLGRVPHQIDFSYSCVSFVVFSPFQTNPQLGHRDFNQRRRATPRSSYNISREDSREKVYFFFVFSSRRRKPVYTKSTG